MTIDDTFFKENVIKGGMSADDYTTYIWQPLSLFCHRCRMSARTTADSSSEGDGSAGSWLMLQTSMWYCLLMSVQLALVL